MPAPQYAREIPQRYRLEAARCAACRKIAFPPRRVCPSCHGESFETLALSDQGTLVTWTVIHVAPSDLAEQAPYVVGIVELDEGVRVTAQIADCEPDALEFGAPVRRVLRRLRAEGPGGILQYGYKFVPRKAAGS
jgi:uncharacterized OB-fold protein